MATRKTRAQKPDAAVSNDKASTQPFRQWETRLEKKENNWQGHRPIPTLADFRWQINLLSAHQVTK